MLPYVAPLVALMLRWCYNRVWVVPRDFLATIRAHRHPNQVTVLCASHTSYMDFIVLPFILYAMSPFLDIERPRIVACRTFAAIPVLGTIPRWCGAVYVDRPGHPVSLATSRQSLVDTLLECILRDRTIVPTLATTIEPPPTRGPCFLVFPSGTRSRDGVTQGPVRTGFLRALWSAARSAGVEKRANAWPRDGATGPRELCS